MTTRRRTARGWVIGLGLALEAALGVLCIPGTAGASHLDGLVWTFPTPPPLGSNDFINGKWTYPGPSQLRSPTSSQSGPYLGNFGAHTVTFEAIDALEIIALQRDRAYLSFDVILSGAWFGGLFDPDDPAFKNFFTVVANGKTLFDSRVDSSFYPDGGHFDLTFDFTPLNPNCCTDVDISFSMRLGSGYELFGLPEPTWGIDNFVVSSMPIPEPSTGALVGLGLGVLGARRRDPAARL